MRWQCGCSRRSHVTASDVAIWTRGAAAHRMCAVMTRISLSHPLPSRPRPLALDELDRVFGGCARAHEACFKDSDCCPSAPDAGMQNYGCVGQGAGGTCNSFSYV